MRAACAPLAATPQRRAAPGPQQRGAADRNGAIGVPRRSLPAGAAAAIDGVVSGPLLHSPLSRLAPTRPPQTGCLAWSCNNSRVSQEAAARTAYF